MLMKSVAEHAVHMLSSIEHRKWFEGGAKGDGMYPGLDCI